MTDSVNQLLSFTADLSAEWQLLHALHVGQPPGVFTQQLAQTQLHIQV